MQVYHFAGTVIATHADVESVPAGAYGDAKRVIVPDGVGLTSDGEAPPTLPDDLASMKALAHATISTWKRAVQDGGFDHAGKHWDSDDRSRLLISGAVQMAQIALAQKQAFSVQWVAADNTASEFDAGGIIALGMAAGQHVAAVHAQALTYKSVVAAATTIEEVQTVLSLIGAWGP